MTVFILFSQPSRSFFLLFKKRHYNLQSPFHCRSCQNGKGVPLLVWNQTCSSLKLIANQRKNSSIYPQLVGVVNAYPKALSQNWMPTASTRTVRWSYPGYTRNCYAILQYHELLLTKTDDQNNSITDTKLSLDRHNKSTSVKHTLRV